jgi:predicted transcriptional regulator
MHDVPNQGRPPGAPDPFSCEYEVQKVVLAELVIGLPPLPDDVGDLTTRLRFPRHEVDAAVTALIEVGLVERAADGRAARASATARYFEYLWPVML